MRSWSGEQNLKSRPSLYCLKDDTKHFKFCRQIDYVKLPTAVHKFLSYSLHSHIPQTDLNAYALSDVIVMCVYRYTVIGAEFSDIRPLDEAQVRTLSVNGVQLLDLIDPNHEFVTELANVGCITWSQREHIVDTVYRRDRNDKLLEFLTRRSVAHFNKFIKVLSKYQAHLVQLLITDGGERF